MGLSESSTRWQRFFSIMTPRGAGALRQDTAQPLGVAAFQGGAWLGNAGRGAARPDMAWHGKELVLFTGLGMARRGEARPGKEQQWTRS